MTEELIELHNRQAGEIVKQIVAPTIAAGGNSADVLVLLESVMVGTLTAVSERHQQLVDTLSVLNLITVAVKERLLDGGRDARTGRSH